MIDERKKTSISALVDGEDAGRLYEVLADVRGDDELSGTWERYHLIGQVLRGEAVDPRVRSIAGSVARVIAGEPVPISRHPALRRPPAPRAPVAVAGFAAAAALAAVVVVPVLLQGGGGDSARPAVVADRGWVPADDAANARHRGRHPPGLSKKLDRLLVNHQEALPLVGVMGMLPYATLVGYGGGR